MKNLPKGSCIFVDNWWFVVVKDRGESLDCICDNANNIYNWEHRLVSYSVGPVEAAYAQEYRRGEETLLDIIEEREIPISVIIEVLVGQHDDRFN